jgi:hypothetical protein
MKTLILIVSAFCLSIATYAQNLTAKTNDIHLNLEVQRGEVVMPLIKWISPAMEYTNSTEKKVKFSAIIESPVPIATLSFVATKTSGLVLGTKNFAAAEGLMKFEISEELVIPDGDNLISIEVETKSGGKVSSNRHILVGMDAVSNAVAIDRKDYAIFFATDKYDNWGDLVNPVFDSHTIADELKENFGFEVEVIENPTPEMVFEKILEYSQKTYKPQDQLMVFFAGHGHFDEAFGEGYIVATNSLSNDPSRTSYISHNRLRSIINNIPTQHTLLVMDACFGGTFDPRIASARALTTYESDDKEMLARKLSYKTRRYLTSGGKEYVSDGVAGEHSPFARKFMEALKSKGGDDRILTLTEVMSQMERITPTPRAGEFGDNESLSDFVFVAKTFGF